jgi:YjbR
MATAKEFREVALSLEGTSEAPHFDRAAFRARRIFATLAPDGLTANIRFPPEEQAFRCEVQPQAYRPIPNKWGASGWTIAELSALGVDDLRVALTSAWRQAAPPAAGRKRAKR